MTRRIILMRHAKSSWTSGAPNDHSRPLNPRGLRAAPRIGKELARLGWRPDFVLSSDSTRTQQTWQHMAPAFEPAPEVRFEPSLYLAGPTEIRDAIRTVDDAAETVLLLGHNPGWEEALSWLTGIEAVMKTAYAALLTAETDRWSDALETSGAFQMKKMLNPKKLKNLTSDGA